MGNGRVKENLIRIIGMLGILGILGLAEPRQAGRSCKRNKEDRNDVLTNIVTIVTCFTLAVLTLSWRILKLSLLWLATSSKSMFQTPSGEPRGTGKILYATEEDAYNALEQLNRKMLDGFRVKIQKLGMPQQSDQNKKLKTDGP